MNLTYFASSDENQNVDTSRSHSENYKSIKWNENLAKDLLKTYSGESISVSCKYFNGNTFEGFVGDEVQPPMIIDERPKQITSCSENGKSLRDSPVCDVLGDCFYQELNTTVAQRRKFMRRKSLKPLRRSDRRQKLKRAMKKLRKRLLRRKKAGHGRRRAEPMSESPVRRHTKLLKKSKDE